MRQNRTTNHFFFFKQNKANFCDISLLQSTKKIINSHLWYTITNKYSAFERVPIGRTNHLQCPIVNPINVMTHLQTNRNNKKQTFMNKLRTTVNSLTSTQQKNISKNIFHELNKIKYLIKRKMKNNSKSIDLNGKWQILKKTTQE